MLKKPGLPTPSLLLAATLLLAAVPALAARGPGETPAAPAAARSEPAGLAARAWQWVQALFGEQGACIDPDGSCANVAATPAATAETDRGACIDPDGRCLAATAIVRH